MRARLRSRLTNILYSTVKHIVIVPVTMRALMCLCLCSLSVVRTQSLTCPTTFTKPANFQGNLFIFI